MRFLQALLCEEWNVACTVPCAHMLAFSALYCRVVQKQMAFMLGRHGVFLELSEDVEEYEDLTEIMSNVQLNSNFLALAREVSALQTAVSSHSWMEVTIGSCRGAVVSGDLQKTHLEWSG